MKEWLKEFLAVLLCIFTLILSTPQTAFASSGIYEPQDNADKVTYYAVNKKTIENLFSLSALDIAGGKAIDWIFNFRSFTIIKERTSDNGDLEYKVYFNTPNLQTIVKNQVISTINDGYTDSAYDVNETEWMVKVGPDEDSENAITKYGFAIPNYTYTGEYPKEVMSVAGIVPTNFWEGLWRAILSLFGISFIDAPDASNYNTISYLNHQYGDSGDLIVSLFQKYYIKYFTKHIKNETFHDNPEELINASVTKEEKDEAEKYVKDNEAEFKRVDSRYTFWDSRKSSSLNMSILGSSVPRYSMFYSGDIIANGTDGSQDLRTWINYHYVDGQPDSAANKDKYSGVDRRSKIAGEINANRGLMNSLANLSGISPKSSYEDNNEALIDTWYRASMACLDKLTMTITGDPPTCTHDGKVYTVNGTFTASVQDIIYHYGNTIQGKHDYTVQEYDRHANCSDNHYETGVHHGGYVTNTYTHTDNYTYEQIFGNHLDDKILDGYSINDIANFISNSSLFGGFSDRELDTFITKDEQMMRDIYLSQQEVVDNYNLFTNAFKDDHKVDNDHDIGYTQCLIKSDTSTECKATTDDGQTVSISIMSLYAYSGLYLLTKHVTGDTLTPAEASQVISHIQTYCGPYYGEVIQNIIVLMTQIAEKNGDFSIYNDIMDDDPRVMPYDVDQLTVDDRNTYGVTDPRVSLYKSHIIGGLVSDFTINFGFGIYIKPQQLLVSLAGKITEISVFLQQLCNFKVLEDLGLSPTNMWTSAFTTLLMAMLALFFIIQTVYAIIKMGTRSGAKILISFLCLAIELGFVFAVSVNPDAVWGNIRDTTTKIMTLGEKTSQVYNSYQTRYLFGDAGDTEVMYYLPYLDIWSKYNTGYGLQESQQLINDSDPEMKNFTKDVVKIGNSNVNHYSILLADAFSYYGNSASVTSSIVIKDDSGNLHTYNGTTINNNAYRVVDHFLAPRVTVDKNGDKLTLSVDENENYNDQFQNGFIDLIGKFLNCLLMCLLSVMKFFTFLWQWFMLYILVFKIILGKGAEGKNIWLILLETFAPTICIVGLGVYSGIILQLGMITSGIFGIILNIALFALTFLVIRWWKHLKQGLFFPKTLEWLYIITNLKQHNRRRNYEQLRQTSENNAKDAGVDMTEEELSNLDKRTEKLFNEDGTFKQEYNNDKYNKVYRDWYKFARNSKDLGKELTPQEIAAMRQFETDDRYKQYAQDVIKYGGKRADKKIKQNQNKKQPTKNTSPENTDNNNSNENSNENTNEDNNENK